MAVTRYVDIRDTLLRLNRVRITGGAATAVIAVADPAKIRAMSDLEIALAYGGIYVPPNTPPPGSLLPGTYGAGPYGSGPYGGAGTGGAHIIYPGPTLFPGAGLYPSD